MFAVQWRIGHGGGAVEGHGAGARGEVVAPFTTVLPRRVTLEVGGSMGYLWDGAMGSIFNGKIHLFLWPFSIAMLNYQRVVYNFQ